ncbi:hypothetical protein TWF694_002466 [Orbilia ellipsospora]|uniref:Uncharacterized protein n=1 Tax=Orbilia ellipsospora TaxID=2528407 RepID=A0AAV9X2A5_9PEZI
MRLVVQMQDSLSSERGKRKKEEGGGNPGLVGGRLLARAINTAVKFNEAGAGAVQRMNRRNMNSNRNTNRKKQMAHHQTGNRILIIKGAAAVAKTRQTDRGLTTTS